MRHSINSIYLSTLLYQGINGGGKVRPSAYDITVCAPAAAVMYIITYFIMYILRLLLLKTFENRIEEVYTATEYNKYII